MVDNIFNETKMAEDIIENGFKNGNMNKYEMIFATKYFLWTIGHGRAKAKTELIKFCKKNDKNFNAITNSNLINDVIRISERNRFKEVEHVQITINEINRIKSVKNFEYQKTLFVLLVFAKALKFTFTKTNKKASNRIPIGYYVSNRFIPKIKKASKIRTSKVDFIYMFHEFFKIGLVESTYFNSIRVLFVDDKGVPEIIVDNFDDIVGFYIDYCGGKIYYCKKCDAEVEKRGRKKSNYCDDCKIEKRRKQTKNRVKKHRRKI